jgi:hypothetical protein
MRKGFLATAILAAGLASSACANLTPTQQRTLTGGAAGAAGGAIIGAIAGNAGLGAAIGGAAGAGGGFLYGKHKEAEDAAYQRGVQDGRTTK